VSQHTTAQCKKISELAKQLRDYFTRAEKRNKGRFIRSVDASLGTKSITISHDLLAESLESDDSTIVSHDPTLGSSARQSFPGVSAAGESVGMRRLLLDMRLMGADNRFLQEELEKRDRMLSRLTEGLREVEVVQTDYQLENIRLREALDKTKAEMDSFAQDNQSTISSSDVFL
jgi:hypothetical protein